MNHIAFDYETFYSSKLKYSLKTLIAETYCQHHLFDPYMLAVYDGEQSWVGNPKDFNWNVCEGRDMVAHNAYFEAAVTSELKRSGRIPPVNFGSLSCTANMSAYLCGRRSLEQSWEHLYKEKVDKSARADANNKKWPVDFDPVEQKVMLSYALGDAVRTWRLFRDYKDRWPAVEQKLSRITIEQGLKGVQIDVELLEKFIIQSHEMLAATEKLIPWIKDADDEEWEDFNAKPTSTKCIAEQCRKDGIPCPPVKSEDEEAYEEWEVKYSPGRPWIKSLGAWRSVNKLYKTFLVMKSRLRVDGTMPFALLYFGAHTGRWSATAKVNFQNQRKKPVFCNEHGLLETDESHTDAAMTFHEEQGKWPEWVQYAIDFRSLIIPRPGKKMIVSDLSQIEPRVLAWLCGDTATLEMLKAGMSIYEAHARSTMGWTGGDLKKENPRMYVLAKARVLGLGYGAGWNKFITMAMSLTKLDITTDDPEFIQVPDLATGQLKQVSGYGFNSKKIVTQFRADNPQIVALWRKLDESMKRSVGEDFIMKLPNGRAMHYERVRGERRIEPDPETGLPRAKSVYTVGVGYKRTMTYGGKLTENLVQATARDVFGEHIVRMDALGWKNLFGVHDEAVQEVDQDITAKDVEHEMSYCPEWLAGCPVGAEAHEVACYQKL